jgi:hypothetical protein
MLGVPGVMINILGGHSIGHSKQKIIYIHVSYSERFPRCSCFNVQFQNCSYVLFLIPVFTVQVTK